MNTEPTEAQKEAGNYKKDHVQVGTFDITIEQPQGSVRRGTDANGKKWESKMHNTYGYFRGTEGVDGDHIDVFLSNDIDGWNGRKVYVVDQYNPDGTFDEHKVMLGFNDADEAKSDYLANYEKGWENGRRIDVSATNLEDFEKWIGSSKRKTKPFAEYAGVKKETTESKPSEASFSAFARQYGLDAEDVAQYAEGVEKGSSAEASRAMIKIGRKIIAAHEGEIHSLHDMRRLRRPVEEALKEKFGDVDKLIEERLKQVEEERNAMEAARKRAEEEEAKRRQHLEELSMLTADDIDRRYAEAIDKGDEQTAREMLDEAARRKGYDDTESEYQGVGAWEAPSNPGYESDEARRADVEKNAPDVNLEDMALGYSLQPDDYFTHPERYSQDTPHGRESAEAIQTALDALKRGDKDVKVKVYRAVPTSVKEGSLRNGDWVTPSKKYAEMHGEHRLEGKYRIIEDEVSAKDLWWDGNDANEWGYDNGKDYKYKNARNNRKQNDLVTRDDKGNVIPPSKRFNQRKADERYQKGEGTAVEGRERVLRDTVVDVLRENGMDVSMSAEEGQRVLDEANEKVRMSAKKRRALETASLGTSPRSLTVVSSADGAKVLKNVETLATELDKSSTQPKTFIGDVAKAIGAERFRSGSEYATFETKNGQVVTIRLANHNAHASGFDHNRRDNGISIVISPKPNTGITNDGNAHIVEFYYDSIKLRRAAGKTLAEIVRSIEQALYSGEFKDTTGLAEVQEVNADEVVRFFRTANGEAYGFTVGGKIYIDPRIANAETPIHEYAHLWASALRHDNPKEWHQGKALYIDKEKIQTLIGQQRTNLADVDYLDLDSVAKVVQDFENPTTEDAKNTDEDENTLFRMAEDARDEENMRHELNNDSEGSGWSRDIMREAWDKAMSGALFFAKEGYVDYLASVDEFQKLVARASGRAVSDMENVYKAMLQLSSKNANEMKLFESALARPLQRAVLNLVGGRMIICSQAF